MLSARNLDPNVIDPVGHQRSHLVPQVPLNGTEAIEGLLSPIDLSETRSEHRPMHVNYTIALDLEGHRTLRGVGVRRLDGHSAAGYPGWRRG